MNQNQIVQKLWKLCDILRDDGVSYQQYVTELTLLLFLKMAKEREIEEITRRDGSVQVRIPEGMRWGALKAKSGTAQLDFYKRLLIDLGSEVDDPLVKGIYAGAGTSIDEPVHLGKLITDIDALDWYSADKEDFGDLYEGLLEKNAGETKSGAGQYFTPRPLIDSMVALMQPAPGEVIQDPSAGSAGFLIAADRHIKAKTDDHFELNEAEAAFQREQAFVGMEIVKETRRLALMNCLLHDIEGPKDSDGTIHLGDTLSPAGKDLPQADVILANPPFGNKKGGRGPTRDDFTHTTNNKQLAFLQHIYRGLKKPVPGQTYGGRAAVVLPDNVLFEGNTGRAIRKDLMDKCHLHTILRLPTGIFYKPGVKTNVLFFSRGKSDEGCTKETWVYDLRTNMPRFGKRTPFSRTTLKAFEDAFGDDVHGDAERTDGGEEGRLRKFSRADIEKRNYNLDLTWLKDDSAEAAEDLPAPEVLVQEIQGELKTALAELDALAALLAGDDDQMGVAG